jgi:dihydrofolate synthase/folylpolyglutamate synthase
VAWLYGTQLHGIKLGLENMRRLVSVLGIRTQGDTPPRFLHVAGTNGKGSTCAMLESICRAAGLKTGLFTSPHLVTFRERMRFNGAMISEEEVADGIGTLREIVETWDRSPTFFELTTALALSWFQTRGAEIVILETGMGGRLDATNVVTPLASLVTAIDLDHQQWLGATLPEIALEKAGIIKIGIPVVSLPQHDAVLCVLAQIALERDAPLHLVSTPLTGFPLNLAGVHQRWNAALALHALDVAGFAFSDVEIVRGLQTVQWPGRFQRVAERFILDGAHNAAAAQALAATWQSVYGERKATLIFGALKDKEVDAICHALLPIAARVLAVTVRSERARSAEDLARIIREIAPALPCLAMTDLESAIATARRHDQDILVTGSLFLVGEALTRLQGGLAFEPSAQ